MGSDLAGRVAAAVAAHQHAARTAAEEEERLVAETAARDSCLEAQKIVQGVAAALQQAVHDQVAQVVSRCLEAVFEEPYAFRIRFEQKRGRTEALLDLYRDGEAYDPVSSVGGGVVDVIAFGLRLAVLMVSTPRLRRLLVLDEPFRMVSVGYTGRLRGLLESLAADLGVQIVMVTHDPDLACGRVVRF